MSFLVDGVAHSYKPLKVICLSDQRVLNKKNTKDTLEFLKKKQKTTTKLWDPKMNMNTNAQQKLCLSVNAIP